MSDVRLSSSSPTLDPMNVRQLHDVKASVCRNLFGCVDHEELKRDFLSHMKSFEESAEHSWDFHFSSHQPKPSERFRWEAVEVSSVPDFYSRSLPGKSPAANGDSDGHQHQQHHINHINHHHDEDVSVNHKCVMTQDTSPQHHRTTHNTDDSLCHTKRTHTCVDEVCRTPRKAKRPRRHPRPSPT